MMKIMGRIKVKDKEILIGQQNFEDGTVNVKVDDEIITCKMFQDEDGDIGFIYNEEYIYFRFVKYY